MRFREELSRINQSFFQFQSFGDSLDDVSVQVGVVNTCFDWVRFYRSVVDISIIFMLLLVCIC